MISNFALAVIAGALFFALLGIGSFFYCRIKYNGIKEELYEDLILAFRVLVEQVAKENSEGRRKDLSEDVRAIADKLSFCSPGKLMRLAIARKALFNLADMK